MPLDPKVHRTWFIYKITSPSDRVYIGVTNNVNNRFRQYRSAFFTKSQPQVALSFNKYGVDSHVFDIIDSFEGTLSQAYSKEKFWIRSHMSNLCKYPSRRGLNLTDGGGGGLGNKKSDDFKKAVGERAKGRRHTEEWKKQNSERHKGNKYNLGRKHTEEWKLAQVKRLTGVKHSAERVAKLRASLIQAKGVKVVQLDKNGQYLRQFETIQQAAQSNNITQSTVSSILKKKRVSRNYFFIYKDSNDAPNP
jgi:group I intron endonuclease